MTVLTHTDEQINEFCARLAPIESAYAGHAMLGYCALRCGDKWQLYSARLSLDHTMPRVRGAFRSDLVLAGRIPVDNRGLTSRQLIDGFLGTFSVDGATVNFEAEDNGSYSAYLVPHHRSTDERTALATLKFRGGRGWERVDRDKIGWHLRGSEMPFESLAELCAAFEAGEEPGGMEIVAAPVVRILPSSNAKLLKAELVIACAADLETRPCRLSYRVLQGATVIERSSVDGGKLGWDSIDGQSVATHKLEVPEGALIDCAVSYRGETNHQSWVVDRSAVQNPRRAAFEPSDTDLAEMRMLLSSDSEKQHARGFEAAIAWLLWMLGFSPAHLCHSSHHENGPDLLVECEGSLVIVECTVGQLKADKRSKLAARCVDIRESLVASRNHDAFVLPVLVTRFTREQAAADFEEAAKDGQHVLTREDLLLLLDRTRQTYSATAIFSDWKHALESRQASLQRPSNDFS